MDTQQYGGTCTGQKRCDPAEVYNPTARPYRSPTKPRLLPTRFPDEEHTYHPNRRVQVTRLHQNALPPPSPSPTTSFAVARKHKSTSAQRQRIANVVNSELWGFDVKYSPTQERGDAWRQAERDERAQVEREHEVEEARQWQQHQREVKVHSELSRQDYSLYLYLAAKYGALDCIMYCSTSFPGRLYALMIDHSVRKIQKWRRERLQALRQYWIVTLAKSTVSMSLEQAFAHIQLAMDHQRRASVFLNRLRWRFAASAFRSWFEFSQRQIEVRWRSQFAVHEDLHSRFVQWRERIAHVKAFKMQLKQIAKRKRMQAALALWLEWLEKRLNLRAHLHQQWTKLQRNCFSAWRVLIHVYQQEKHAAIRLESQWRAYHQRNYYRRCKAAARIIAKMTRGWLARRFVALLRHRMSVVESIERIVRVIEWGSISTELERVRAAAIHMELARGAGEVRFLDQAEQQTVQFIRSELGKVRKNATHRKLQHIVDHLYSDGVPTSAVPSDGNSDSPFTRGGRTQEGLAQLATRMLLQQAAADARHAAQADFLSQIDDNGTLVNLPVRDGDQCVVCTATSAGLAGLVVHTWIPAAPRCLHSRSLPAADPSTQHSIYRQISVEAAAWDANVERKLIHDPLTIPSLWRLL